MESIRIEDDGMIEINGSSIDIAVASELLSRAVRDSNGDEVVYHQTLRDAIIQLGITPMSHIANHRVATTIWSRNREIQKKDAATLGLDAAPGSQTTTESTPTG